MPVGCGSASVTSSSIRASDAAVPTAAVVDCLSTNHWVRPQLGLVPEKRHQLPGKPLLIFEQWDQQVRQLRSRAAPQLLAPSLPETPSLPLCSLTQLLPCKKNIPPDEETKRGPHSGQIEPCTRVRGAKKQNKTTKTRRKESEQRQWGCDGRWGVCRSHLGISVGSADGSADHHRGPRETAARRRACATVWNYCARLELKSCWTSSPEYHARFCELLVAKVTQVVDF